MARVIVTGARGMLGTDVVAVLVAAGHEVRGLTRAGLDVTDAAAVAAADLACDVVVNCTAHTAVDDAETAEADAFAVNAVAPQLLARAAGHVGAAIVHVSTDYVFDGAAVEPYDEDAPLAPRSAYGRTKAAGEWAVRAETDRHWVVRTAWLYGAHGSCFPTTIARLAADRDELSVVADQIGQPTWTRDVAERIEALISTRAPFGTYHATSSGQGSWFDLAERVVAAAPDARATLVRTTTEAFPRPAPRPAWSVLGHRRWHEVGIEPIGDWQQRWEAAAPSVLGLR
jgi:dTDP-4-dehydrorhamnose reductase